MSFVVITKYTGRVFSRASIRNHNTLESALSEAKSLKKEYDLCKFEVFDNAG